MKALDNQFYVKSMQLEIGLLTQTFLMTSCYIMVQYKMHLMVMQN